MTSHNKKITFAVGLLFLCSLFCYSLCFHVNAKSYSSEIVINQNSGKTIKGQNIHVRLPMASTTKIMTAIVAIENVDLNEVIEADAASCNIEGSSIYIKVGEQLSYFDLLYGLMLRSGNDCAMMIANHAFSNYNVFIQKMNEKAQSLGLKNTNFTNPHGLHDSNHFTSAYDLAVITSYALNNPVFAKIVKTKKITIGDRYLYNKNKMLNEYAGAIGVKTGFTKNSGRCLVSAARRNDETYVCVVLNCYDMWARSKQLLDFAFGDKS